VRALPLRALLVAAAVLAVAATRGLSQALIWDAEALRQGEVWRLATGHLVHAGTSHLVWDVLPLLAIGLLFERTLGGRWWRVLAVSAIVVSGGLLLTDLARYCGLSGVLNGLWIAGALAAAREESAAGRHAMAWVYRGCLGADVAKILAETMTGAPLFTDAAALGADPVPMAHLLGAAAGFLCDRFRTNIYRVPENLQSQQARQAHESGGRL